MNGYSHDMSKEFVIKVIILGWVSFVMAIFINCVYYILHPMAPQVNPKNKLETYLFGKRIRPDGDLERPLTEDNNVDNE